MGEAVLKRCNGCGIDVNNQKRTKDSAGRYFCAKCWQTMSLSDTSTSALNIQEQTPAAPQPSAGTDPPKEKSLLHTDLGQAALAKLPPAAQQRLQMIWLFFGLAIIVAIHIWLLSQYEDEGSDALLYGIVQLVIVGTSIWVAYDSAANRILPPARRAGIGGPFVSNANRQFEPKLDPLRWLGACLALWIVVIPLYLSKRVKAKTNNPAILPDPAEELRKYKQLLDDGIISQDEWASKRRELLGIN